MAYFTQWRKWSRLSPSDGRVLWSPRPTRSYAPGLDLGCLSRWRWGLTLRPGLAATTQQQQQQRRRPQAQVAPPPPAPALRSSLTGGSPPAPHSPPPRLPGAWDPSRLHRNRPRAPSGRAPRPASRRPAGRSAARSRAPGDQRGRARPAAPPPRVHPASRPQLRLLAASRPQLLPGLRHVDYFAKDGLGQGAEAGATCALPGDPTSLRAPILEGGPSNSCF